MLYYSDERIWGENQHKELFVQLLFSISYHPFIFYYLSIQILVLE